MCKKEKLPFVDHINITPKTHLNRSKLHLNHNGYKRLGKNFISFIRNNYTWLPVASKKVYSDFDDSPTFAEVNNELVDYTSNKDLKPLRIKNLNKIVVGHLNINSVRNKFYFLANQETLIYLWYQTENLIKVSLQISFYKTVTVCLSVLTGMEIWWHFINYQREDTIETFTNEY